MANGNGNGKPPIKPAKKVIPRHIDPEKLLTEEQKETIRAKARDKINARDIIDAEEKYLADEMARLEREKHPETLDINDELRDIRIDLAMYADRLIIDGRTYFHGSKYTVPKSLYDVIMEAQQASYRHEEEIHGNTEYDKFYRRERGLTMSFKTGATAQASGQPVRF